MKLVRIDEYTMTALPITLLCKGSSIGTATGFFYRHDGRLFLISNWHVFSGRNCYTGQALRRDAALPDTIQMPLHERVRVGSYSLVTFPLEDRSGLPFWLAHERGQDIDVAALELRGFPEQCITYELPRPGEAAEMSLEIGMDAYVIGFPRGLTHQKFLPIWKRASIATEPALPQNNDEPVFLVDTATREGMSGSPVVLRSFGGFDQRSDDGSASRSLGVGAFTRFVGVYSGRFGSDDALEAQLGRVWRREVITEIILQGRRGSYELR